MTAPNTTAAHEGLLIACLGVAIVEIRKIADPKRRAAVARNAAAALKDAVNAE